MIILLEMSSNIDPERLERLVLKADALVLEGLTNAGSGHASTALSLGHIVGATLAIMQFNKNNPSSPGSDRIVLSEGHGVPILYALVSLLRISVGNDILSPRYIPEEEVRIGIRDVDFPYLGGHPQPATGFGFHPPLASGSLGKGLSFAGGVAWANRYMDDTDSNVYVIIGDGEYNKGQITEALSAIENHGLTRVIPIINCNGYQQTGTTQEISGYDFTDIQRRLESLGYSVSVPDGHNLSEMLLCLDEVSNNPGHNAIIALTKKGWGVESLNNTHGSVLPPEDLEAAIDEMYQTAGIRRDGQVHYHFNPTRREIHLRDLRPREIDSDPEPKFEGMVSPREGYGRGVEALAKVDPRVVVLTADVENSDLTKYVKESTPDQFIQMGIAEATMIGYANGITSQGLIPFASSFGAFLFDAYGEINTGQLSGLKIKIAATHGSPDTGPDGPSQQGLADIGFMSSFPGMVILSAADAYAAFRFPELAANHNSSVYMRLPREKTPVIYNPSTEFKVGGAHVIKDDGEHATIVAHGYMVSEALKAAEALREEGIYVNVVDAYSINPLGWDTVKKSADSTKGRILTVEGNFKGGLDAQVNAAVLGDEGQYSVANMFLENFPISGRTADDVLKYVGLSYNHIAEKARELVGK